MSRVALDSVYGIESQITRDLSVRLGSVGVTWNDQGISMVSAQLKKTIVKLEQQELFPPPGWERNTQGQI